MTFDLCKFIIIFQKLYLTNSLQLIRFENQIKSRTETNRNYFLYILENDNTFVGVHDIKPMPKKVESNPVRQQTFALPLINKD